MILTLLIKMYTFNLTAFTSTTLLYTLQMQQLQNNYILYPFVDRLFSKCNQLNHNYSTLSNELWYLRYIFGTYNIMF